MFNHQVCRRITSLLWRNGPSAVAWLIAFIVFNAVDGVPFRRSFAHVCKERHEISTPSITHQYPSTAISLVASAILIGATGDDTFPNFVFSSFGKAVSSSHLPQYLCTETPTTFRHTFPQNFTDNFLVWGTAITPAYPICSMVFHPRKANHGQYPEPLTSEFYQLTTITSVLNHAGILHITMCESNRRSSIG